MPTEEFTVKNVKCGGCVATLHNGLKDLPGVCAVEVTLAGQVTVRGEHLDRTALGAKLAALGYPVAQ